MLTKIVLELIPTKQVSNQLALAVLIKLLVPQVLFKKTLPSRSLHKNYQASNIKLLYFQEREESEKAL